MPRKKQQSADTTPSETTAEVIEKKEKKTAPSIPTSTPNHGIATVVATRGADVVATWGGFDSREKARPFRNEIIALSQHDGSDLSGCCVRIARGKDHPDGSTVDLHHLIGEPQEANRKARKNKRRAPVNLEIG